MSADSDITGALSPVVAAFARLGIRYHVGGSVASSSYGAARSTYDVDVVAEVEARHAAPLTAALSGEFYVDEEMILDAVRRRSCFNVIHSQTVFKVDVFVAGDAPYEREALGRSTLRRLSGVAGTPEFRVASPEDVILAKLRWYRAGGEQSERQWSDISSVIKVQRGRLDREYLHRWAEVLGVEDLLNRALP